MKLALASTYELLKEPQVSRWNRLADELAQRGTQLFLLSTQPVPGLQVPHLQIPYGLAEFNSLALRSQPVPGEETLLDIEQYWVRDFNREASASGLSKCRAFYEDILDCLQPDVVNIWNTNLPQGRVLQLLCEERDIVAFSIEQGQLPHTLLLDNQRQNSSSELNNSLTLASVARSYSPKAQLVSAYRDYYRRQKPAKYGEGEQATAQSQLLTAAEKPLLLVLGQACGGGVLPRNNPLARRTFPAFASYEEALTSLLPLTATMQIGFRDHPINVWENDEVVIPAGVLRLQGGPLHELIETATVVVVLGGTSALFEVLVLQKPLVVVGRTSVSQFKPYVECLDGDIVSAVRTALAQGFDAIQRPAERALSFLLEHCLIAERDEVPALQKLSDFADFLARYDNSCELSLPHRFEQLAEWAKGV